MASLASVLTDLCASPSSQHLPAAGTKSTPEDPTTNPGEQTKNASHVAGFGSILSLLVQGSEGRLGTGTSPQLPGKPPATKASPRQQTTLGGGVASPPTPVPAEPTAEAKQPNANSKNVTTKSVILVSGKPAASLTGLPVSSGANAPNADAQPVSLATEASLNPFLIVPKQLVSPDSHVVPVELKHAEPDAAFVTKAFTATANSSGQIVIGFVSVVDNAKISGIEIIPN